MRKEEEAKQEKERAAPKTQEQRDEDAIHPSRRARVPYGRK
jgi:nucleolar protein 6